MPVIIHPADPARREQAAELARRLGLRYAETAPAAGLVLEWTRERLQLRLAEDRATVAVDFVHGALDYRRRHGGGIKQDLARAVGIKPGQRPWVVDATAGWGRDAFILAALGCRVSLIERNPAQAALLEDGLARAAADPDAAPIAARMELLHGDAADLLAGLEADSVYLDPMYPERRKTAAVKKDMRLLRALAGDDLDAAALLAAARASPAKRVAVKRPSHAEVLGGATPDAVIQGSATRFDIYLRPQST